MIGLLSVALAGWEVFAWATDRPTVSHARGWYRVGVFGWFAWLGVHLVYEAIADDIGEAAAAQFTGASRAG